MATIRKRNNGKYQVQVRRKGFNPTSRSFHNRRDAEEWARYMETKADRGELPAPIKVLDARTVKEILQRYRDEVTVKKRSADTETYILNAFIRKPIANLTLAQITPSHFSTYRDKRLKDVKAGTVNRELAIIKHAFDIAMREWDIPLRENPLAPLRKLKADNARERRITDSEYDAIQAASAKTRNRFIMPLIRFAIETGMRRSELLRLKWKDIDLGNKTLHIPLTKNGYARTIPLTNEAVTIIADLKKEKDNDEIHIFPISALSVRMAWERLIARARIQDLHFHDLRHEAISRFFEMGLSVPEVALISGHRDYRMLFRYTHLKAEEVGKKLL